MESLNILALPILVGFSRKSMLTKFLEIKSEEALNGTTVLNTISLQKGAKILRVHDVKAAMECIKAVSYTHLDVYKRQSYNLKCCGNKS